MTIGGYEAVPAVSADDAAPHAGTVVMKFGGTSVGDIERLKAVAQRLVAARERGARVVAVLSAMGETTDELIALAHRISPQPKPRALDMLISVGERISCALAEMAIEDLGQRAVSLTGSQAGIVTDTAHGRARIVDVRARRIHEALDAVRIVLVAGFQGVSTELEVTTLGRGGSDTTAVALAAALGADSCEIYTDVAGVHTADPGLLPDAPVLRSVTYEEMLELAASGARVLEPRSVELGRNHGVQIHVRSSFSDRRGTVVTEEDGGMLEKAIVSSVAHTADESLYRVRDVGRAALFTALADADVSVDTIVQTGPEIVFSAPRRDGQRIAETLDGLGVKWEARADLGKVTLVGAGMKSNPGVAARAFAALEAGGIELAAVTTSPIRIGCHVRAEDVERAVRTLHDAFGLNGAAQ